MNRHHVSMYTKHDYRFFGVAHSISLTSTHERAKIGAAIVVGREVIAFGCNSSTKTHPLQAKYNASHRGLAGKCKHLLHAEIDAVIRAQAVTKNLTGAKIYVYRVLKNGETGMCRPCPACEALLRDVGIRQVFYTTPGGLCYEQYTERCRS